MLTCTESISIRELSTSWLNFKARSKENVVPYLYLLSKHNYDPSSYNILLQIVNPNPMPDGLISSLSPIFPKNLNNLD